MQTTRTDVNKDSWWNFHVCTLGALSYASKTHCARVLFNFENKSRTKRRKRRKRSLTIYHNQIRRSKILKKRRRDKTLSPGKVFETLELTIDEDDIDFQRDSRSRITTTTITLSGIGCSNTWLNFTRGYRGWFSPSSRGSRDMHI